MDIALITEKDYQGCLNFFNSFQKSKRTMEQWYWEFIINSKFVSKVPFVVAKINGEIVGTQALIPIRMINRSGIFLTAKSEETLVDPSMRGKKILKKMYSYLFDFSDRNGILAIWGFTPAKKAFIETGFTVPCQTSQLFLPLSVNAVDVLREQYPTLLAKSCFLKIIRIGLFLSKIYSQIKYKSFRNIKNLQIRTLFSPPLESGLLCKKFVEKWGGSTIYRDAEYLQWRIFDNPYIRPIFRAAYINDKLLGWVIYSLDENSMGYLVDIMAIDANATQKQNFKLVKCLLADCIEHLKNLGAVGIRGWSVTDNSFDKIFRKAARSLGFFYFHSKGQPVVFRESQVNGEDFLSDSFNSWFITRINTEGKLG